MREGQSREPAFVVKRLSPDAVYALHQSWAAQRQFGATRSYNVTTDDQRFELVRRVLSRELSIKEALFLGFD